jgi:hypothetical protein
MKHRRAASERERPGHWVLRLCEIPLPLREHFLVGSLEQS